MPDYANLPYDLTERLAILVDKSANLSSQCASLLRHGNDGKRGRSNERDLNSAVGELMTIVELMMMMGDITPNAVGKALHEEAGDLTKWTHHQSLKALNTLSKGGK